jgi:hypothetical protein
MGNILSIKASTSSETGKVTVSGNVGIEPAGVIDVGYNSTITVGDGSTITIGNSSSLKLGTGSTLQASGVETLIGTSATLSVPGVTDTSIVIACYKGSGGIYPAIGVEPSTDQIVITGETDSTIFWFVAKF